MNDLAATPLRDVILAKIDRKLVLLAELDAINVELLQAYAVLGEIPSVAATVLVPAATATVKKKRTVKPVVKPCARCHQVFELTETRKFCKPCFGIQARERFGRARDFRWNKVPA